MTVRIASRGMRFENGLRVNEEKPHLQLWKGLWRCIYRRNALRSRDEVILAAMGTTPREAWYSYCYNAEPHPYE